MTFLYKGGHFQWGLHEIGPWPCCKHKIGCIQSFHHVQSMTSKINAEYNTCNFSVPCNSFLAVARCTHMYMGCRRDLKVSGMNRTNTVCQNEN